MAESMGDVKMRPNRPKNIVVPDDYENKKELKAQQQQPGMEMETKEPRYIDDMSLFMAWHNYYLTEQNKFLTNLYMFQCAQQQQQIIIGQQQTTLHQTRWPTNFNNTTVGNPTINVGVVTKLASFKKRLAAEFIDFMFLIFVKLFVITYFFGDQYVDRFQYILIVDENTSLQDLQMTLMQALLFRLVAIAYEGYCLSGTLPFSNGATLGKRILGIKVIKCEIVEDINAIERQVRIIPGGHLGTTTSMVRAILKNTVSLFFPMLIPFHMLANYNRLIYDIAIGTVVVVKE